MTAELATPRTLHTLNLEQDQLGGTSVVPALYYHSIPQTNLWILNYDQLQPRYNAEVGHMAGCCRNRVLCCQTRIAGQSNEGNAGARPTLFFLLSFASLDSSFIFISFVFDYFSSLFVLYFLSPVSRLSFAVVLIRTLYLPSSPPGSDCYWK